MWTSPGSAYTPIATTVPALRASRIARSSPAVTDRVDRGVDAAGLGPASDGVAWACLGEVHGRRVERRGDAESLLHAVDRKHRTRPGGERRLHRAQPDRAQAEDAVAGPDAAFRDSVVAGAHHVAGEQGDVVGDVLGDGAQRHVRHRHQRLLGLGPLQRAEGGAVAEDPSPIALLIDAAQAEEAVAAGGVKAPQHAVARRDAGHLVARGEDRADELVPDRETRFDLDAPVIDVEVRSADARGRDLHDRVVARMKLGRRALLDRHPPRGLEGDRSHPCTS
jgi:hypothetical protein